MNDIQGAFDIGLLEVERSGHHAMTERQQRSGQFECAAASSGIPQRTFHRGAGHLAGRLSKNLHDRRRLNDVCLACRQPVSMDVTDIGRRKVGISQCCADGVDHGLPGIGTTLPVDHTA